MRRSTNRNVLSDSDRAAVLLGPGAHPGLHHRTGPISVDGVSLTVIAKDNQTFSVSIVRFTGDHTNIFERAVGDPVNLESDIMMRYVAQAVKNRGGS